MFLGHSFPRSNCVGEKSSERQLSSGAIFRGIFVNYLSGNYAGGQFAGGQLTWEQWSATQ